jgi:hypothetical protein
MATADKPTVRINNWTLIEGGIGSWLAGEVEDHPRLKLEHG